MEQQLSNKEIARVFAMYLGCEIVYQQNHSLVFKVSGIVIENIIDENLETPDRLLLLTPLSKITDEHAIEVAKMYYSTEVNCTAKDGRHIINKYFIKGINSSFITYVECFFFFQYLIQQGYAVPLYFGINHPCNGKDAIELGIAIDKTAVKTGL
jgi:hypothetical protein